MNNPDNGGLGGMFRQPAQRETMTGGYAGEFHIPIIQAFASIVFACVTVLFVWLLLFIIGPDVLWCAGFAAIAVTTRRVLLWIGTAQQETQEEINGARAMTIGTCAVALILLGAWAASRQFCVAIWPITPPTYSPWRIVFAASFIIIPIVVCSFMAAHFLIEAYNPAAFQPHQAKPAGTPWWSPTGQYIEETEPNEYEPEQVIVERTIPRPIPIFNNHEVVGLPSPGPTIIESTSKHEVFKAPPLPGSDKGITIIWKEFVRFIWEGLDVGISTPTWQKRTAWGKPYIAALQATARQHGLAEYRGKGSENVLTIKTKAEAAASIQIMHKCLYPEQYLPKTELPTDL